MCSISHYSRVEAHFSYSGPSVVRGAAVNRALVSEKLFPEDIDARARNVRILPVTNFHLELQLNPNS